MYLPPAVSEANMAPTDILAPTLNAALAEELRMVATLLEKLAETVVSDEEFACRHVEQLQTFDLVIQCAEESAAVLDRMAQGAPSHEAIAPVRLTAVRDRLRHALSQAA